MNNMKKKFLVLLVIIGSLFMFASCEMNDFKVTFDPNGGEMAITEQLVKKEGLIQEPAAPTKEDHLFLGWYLNAEKWDFSVDKVTKPITLTAKWEEVDGDPVVENFEVSFNLDGGTPEISMQTIEKNDFVNEPNAPTKEGFTFLGWYLNEVKWNFSEDKVTEDIILVAKWEEKDDPIIEEVEITFNVDGGTPAPNMQKIDKGTKVEEPDVPTKEGFNFLGWYLNDNLYDFNQVVEQDLTLTAKWEKQDDPTPITYTVSFDVRGGTPNIDNQTVEEDGLVIEPTDPTKTGYSFLGWYLEEVEYSFNNPVTTNMTLVAKWDINTYEVTFDVLGGTPSPSPENVAHGSLVSEPTEPTKEGYIFLGWYLMSTKYNFNNEVTGNLELVAKWNKEDEPIPETYEVSFNLDGGSPSISSQTVEEDGFAIKPTDPTKENYTFVAWYLESAEYNFSTPVTANITLTAKWEINTYDVAFDLDGGTPSINNQNIEHGSLATEPNAPTKDGYQFLGWYLDGSQYSFAKPITTNITLVAKWEINTYDVAFNVDGGTPSINNQNIEHGSLATEPNAPTKDGYQFLGWYLDGAQYSFAKPITTNITLVAKWEKNTYDVAFNVDGGIPSINNQTVEHGSLVTAPTEPTKEGFNFLGWYLNGSQYNFSNPVTSNLNLIAQWEEIEEPVGDEDESEIDVGDWFN